MTNPVGGTARAIVVTLLWLAGYDNKFLVGAATAGTSGGSNTHAHGAGTYAGPSHQHEAPIASQGANAINFTALYGTGTTKTFTSSQGGNADSDSLAAWLTSAAGTGAVTGASASADSRPEFMTIILCQKN